MRTFRIGSRGSKLALWQAQHVAGRLGRLHPADEFRIEVIRTTGDVRTDVPLSQVGDKSLFIKEIESALLEGAIDLAVHSLKDVPSTLDPRFQLAAVLLRDDPRDVVLTRTSGLAEQGAFSRLALGALVGTSSLRREAQLRSVRPDLHFRPIRGNVDTRLRKLDAGEYDAIILAAAGLHRLDIDWPGAEPLDPAVSLPAPGQAAMCIEIVADNAELAVLVAPLEDTTTRRCVEAERAFAAALGAGCEVPLGALAVPIGNSGGNHLRLDGVVASVDGATVIRTSGEGTDPVELGRRVAEDALGRGAARLLALARAS